MDFQKMLKMSQDINEMCSELKLSRPEGLTKFKLNKIQQKILDNINEHKITNAYAARQSGVSTLIALHALQYALFNSDKCIIIVSPKLDQSYAVGENIRFFLEQLDSKILGIKIIVDNKGMIKLSNGTNIIFTSAKSSSIRGRTASIIYLDCLDFLNKKDFDDFIGGILPIISSSINSKIISVNTGCLNGHFKDWEHNINLPYTENDEEYIKQIDDFIKSKTLDDERIKREYLLIV